MAKKRRRLDEYLGSRSKGQEATLEEKTQLSNQLFHLTAGTVFTLFLVAMSVADKELRATYVVALACFFFAVMGIVVLTVTRTHPGLFRRPAIFNQFVFLVVVEVLIYEFVKYSQWSVYVMPLPMFGMIGALVLTEGTALLLGLVLAFYMGVSHPNPELIRTTLDNPLGADLNLMLVLAVGTIVATLSIKPVRRQSKPVVVGFYAGVFQAFTLVSLQVMSGEFDSLLRSGALRSGEWSEFLEKPGWALVGGLLSGAIVTCLLPGIERLFGILTERRLLDLSDFSNDLLRLIQQRVPGTFQHTLNVAQLASAATEAIGADSLLARVGAYYHDLGKIIKPGYFVENMGEDKSIHDRLSPSMSKMIIISHVKDGVALAKEAKLPQKIIDLIPMHHGTTLVEFFFHKARRAAEADEETGTPGDVEYRYPGPKPRFREAGILMLADTLEAMAKAESHPNPSRFRTMVHDVVRKRLLDGQLDESDLTLNDLRVLEDSFVRTLTTMYHGRIKYPEDPGTEKKKGRGPSPEGRSAAAPDSGPARRDEASHEAAKDSPGEPGGAAGSAPAAQDQSTEPQPVRSSRG